MAGVFGFGVYANAATYYASGTLYSTNIATGLTVNSFDYFGYNATIPVNTTLKIMFSQDNVNWYSANHTLSTWTNLANGDFSAQSSDTNLNLSGFTASQNFYYQIAFATTDTTITPTLTSIQLYYNTGTYAAVTTSAATSVAGITAVGNGNITSIGNSAVTERGFQYGVSQTDYLAVSETGSFGTGAYSLTLPNLYASTAYYVRSFVTNTQGRAYGSWQTFTTNAYYNASGTLYSVNLLTGLTVNTIDSFYTSATMPAGTSLSAQFSQDNTNWYSAAGVLNETTTVPDGITTTSLSALNWSGANFYYKITFSASSDKSATPTLTNVSVNYNMNTAPTLTSVATSPNPIKGGSQLTIAPTGQGDAESNTLYYYCAESTAPTSSNTLCSQANTSYTSPYSSMTCTYNVPTGDATRTVYCRTYDGTAYSTERSTTYVVDTTLPITTVSSARVFDNATTTITSTLTCTDTSGSGCSATYYCIDNVNTCTPTSLYTSPVVYSITGTTYIRYYSVDFASNISSTSSSVSALPGGGGPNVVTSWLEPPVPPMSPPVPVTPTTQPAQPTAEQPPSPDILNQLSQQLNSIAQQAKGLALALFQKQQGQKQPAYPPIAEVAPKEAPPALRELKIMSVNPFGDFALSQIKSDVNFFSEKLPQLKKTLDALGINSNKLNDIKRLNQAQLYLPGLTQTVFNKSEILKTNKIANNLQENALAAVKGIPLAKINATSLKKIPSNIVFARTAGELVDFTSALVIDDKGNVKQKITTISGKPIELVIKPDQLARKVSGFVTLKNLQNAQKNQSNQNNLAKNLPAALSAADSAPAPKDSSSNILLVVQKFEYSEIKPGVFKAKINAPTAEGEYEIFTVVQYKDKSLPAAETSLIAVVDPEGYVYMQTADGKLRIEKATVSIYWLNPETKKYELWPARKFLQKNPIITNDTGKYSFLVPRGTYYLTVKAANYIDFIGDPFSIEEDNGVRMDIKLKKKSFLPNWLNWMKF